MLRREGLREGSGKKEDDDEESLFACGGTTPGSRRCLRNGNDTEMGRRLGRLQRTAQLHEKQDQLVGKLDDAQIVSDLYLGGRDAQ